jgi:Glyoxalase/Bleomycin resistance protein/Dioxygenase superfamily
VPETIAGVVLDHVAHAVHHWRDAWARYATDLGAEWNSGGPGAGFAPGQVRFGNGARVELLMPHDAGVNDFLERFLASSGPGPHHLTFKVADIGSAIEQARRSGWEPIGIDLRDPEWMEAFLHPKQATGVVVQLAQALGGEWRSPAPDGYPSDRRLLADGTGPVAPASLLRVTHAVADLAHAGRLFTDLLGGETVGVGVGGGLSWLDLSWGGPMTLRLVAPDGHSGTGPLSEWLGGRSGRVHHLGLSTEEPARVAGAHPIGADEPVAAVGIAPGDGWVVEPEANAGMRLVLADERLG